MGRHSRNLEPIELAVQLSEEIDAEESPATVDESFERFVGENLTTASFSPTVEAATDTVFAHGARVPVSAAQAMMRGADRAMQARRAEIEAAEDEERNYTL